MYEVLTKKKLFQENEQLRNEILKLENEKLQTKIKELEDENLYLLETLSNMSSYIERMNDDEEERMFKEFQESYEG
ncbi:hypothetical protein [Halarcobacter sp.]|uniref:hypothetical protein n=1 Tax=Halarcobacter sp. TaxID=2321133 RepID=UPI002AAAEBE6|nr:hypothetical protein [Halarcobacter sp.]